MSEWRPIESAPRDGSWILVHGDTSDGKPPFVGVTRWVSGQIEDWERRDDDTMKRVWRDDSHWDYERDIYNPTHWMPLPDAPEA